MDLTTFLTSLGIIIAIDIILGGDNAVVIALASRNLPPEKRNKAIFYGTGLAIIIRIIFTSIAVWLLSIKYLMLIGGLLLIWISLKLLVDKEHDDKSIKSEYTLLAAIRTIVIADVAMGIDNVLAIAGAAHGNILLVVLGLMVSIPIIIWGSKLILKALDRYPFIIYIGSAILAFTAGSMITHEQTLQPIMKEEAYLVWLIPLCTIVLVLVFGYVKNIALKKAIKHS